MKAFSILCAFCLLSASAQAAITIIVTPGTSNVGTTRFSVIQTSANPIFSTDFVTVGAVAGITLSGQSVVQDPGLMTVEVPISPSPGTVTKVGGGSASINGLYFVYGIQEQAFLPVLDLDAVLYIPSGNNHQFALTQGVTGEAAIDFFRFLPGTYVESSPVFGTITTIVIPEPGSALLGLVGLGAVTLRRRR